MRYSVDGSVALQSKRPVRRLAELLSLGTLATPIGQMHNLQDFIRETARLLREAHRQLSGPKFLVEHANLVGRMFPYGYAKTLEQIQAGDGSAIEFGLVFVEVQPYFFRSQYIRTLLIRLLKHARLSTSQAERLKRVLELEQEKKMKRKSCAQPAAETQRGEGRQLR